MKLHLPTPIKYGGHRDGLAFRAEDIGKYIISGEVSKIMLCGRSKRSNPIEDGQEYYIMNDVNKAYDDATVTIDKALQAYNKIVSGFRSTIGNDLKSIKSSAEKTVSEYEKIRAAYIGTIQLLTSDDMERAIVNAERMAAALRTIGEVKSAEVNFKLMDNSK